MMADKNNQEHDRRQFNRCLCHFPVRIITEDNWFDGNAINLGLGGMLVVPSGAQFPEVDNSVRLCCQLPVLRSDLEVHSLVRWGDEHAIGLQFIGLLAQGVWGLRQFMERCSK